MDNDPKYMSKINFQNKMYLYQIIKCLHQITSENKPYNLRLCTFTKLNFKRKI